MIRFDSVTITYAGASRPALQDVDLVIEEGEFALVVGPTGSGKTTLLRSINGLVPHFSGGTLRGRVQVAGLDTRTHRPRDVAAVVGYVAQNPATSFVTDGVESEIAYGMETSGLHPSAMRRRVEETLDLFGLTEVRDRGLTSLSGGQQQRVAIAAIFAAGPSVLVLDEPTSALDPVGAEDVLASLDRIVHDLGVTVVLAEHRLERVIHHADRVLLVDQGLVAGPLPPAQAMAYSPVVPPVVQLGRAAGWDPLPLSVRSARRLAGPLRAALATAAPPPPVSAPQNQADRPVRSQGAVVRDVSVRRGPILALRRVELDAPAGTITTVLGRNGSGKSTLLATLAGLLEPVRGQVHVDGRTPATLAPRERVRHVGLVPQDAAALLYADSVAAECRGADRDFGVPAGTTAALVAELIDEVDPARHPRDLSEGQRLSLALAVILASRPPVLLLDEPTRGLDYAAKERLAQVLRGLADGGRSVLVATHDVEFAAETADLAVVLAGGEVVAHGPAARILTESPAFGPQVAKVVRPAPFLTVAQVLATGALSAELVIR